MMKPPSTLSNAIAESLARSREKANCNVGSFLAARFDAADRATIDHYLEQGFSKAEFYRIIQRFGYYGGQKSVYSHLNRACTCPSHLPL